MSVRLVCRGCGKRLKLPEGMQSHRSARCPKCRAVVDLTPALEASAYMPTLAIPEMAAEASTHADKSDNIDTAGPQHKNSSAVTSKKSADKDPLPYLPETTETERKRSSAAFTKPVSSPPLSPVRSPSSSAQTENSRHKPHTQHPGSNTHTEEPLSLDDDPATDQLPEEVTPFRVPVEIVTDSRHKFAGSCFAVFVPHGMFLENEPMKPFLYFPIGCPVRSSRTRELTMTLPDRRTVTLRFTGRSTRALTRDTHAFLAGEQPAPVVSDYEWKRWMLGVAFLFAVGMAVGPFILSQTARLGLDFSIKVGVAFAFLGLLVNILVVLVSRWSVFAQTAVLAGVCLLVTGICLFSATAYLAGRQKALEEANSAPPPPPPLPPQPQAPPKLPDPRPERPPSHLDRAKKNGSSALEDGPAEITALALAPDGNTLGIGHADGTTRLWPLDQPTFEAMLPGPKADNPITSVEFDQKSQFVFVHTTRGVVVAPRTGPPETPAKIPGSPIAIVPEIANNRIRYAAVRGNTIQHRLLPTSFVQHPPTKANGYAIPGKGDEIIPLGNARDLNRGTIPTFLAWMSSDRLLAGQPNGTIMMWNAAMRPQPPNHDHKATVRTWAACPASGEFATGDDRGHVALWSKTGDKTTVHTLFGGAPITRLSFNATGSRLAVADNTGWLVIWDPVAGKALHRTKRPAAIKALTYGPSDNYLILGDNRTVEVWWLPELVK